jgi:DNA gyrase/topoisomerase IV subunit B
MDPASLTDAGLMLAARKLSPEGVCAELIALSVVEFSYTPSLKITVELGSRGGMISDTGRGMRLTPDGGDTLSHAERALTTVYPCLPAGPEIECILRELVWGRRGSLGPALANAACPFFRFESRRDGEAWSQEYRYGRPIGAPARLGPAGASGTVITFETSGPIDHEAVSNLVDELRARVPRLNVSEESRFRPFH